MISPEYKIDDLPTDVIASIARSVFGTSTEVQHVDRLSAGVGNQPYKVCLMDHKDPYVFRFRLRGEDNYDQEVQNYKRIQQFTGITIPQIYCVDRSNKLVSSSYMVMDYLEGLDEDEVLEAGADPEHIQEQVGTFTARVHQDVRKAPSVDQDISHLINGFNQLEEAIKSDYVDLALNVLERCKQTAQLDPKLKSYNQSFCLSDTELCYVLSKEGWRLSFVLDPEWAHYRTTQYDLWRAIAAEHTDWDRPLQVKFLSPQEASMQPFFRGYEQVAAVDYEKLYHVAPYHQLCLWGNIMSSWKTGSHPFKCCYLWERPPWSINRLPSRPGG